MTPLSRIAHVFLAAGHRTSRALQALHPPCHQMPTVSAGSRARLGPLAANEGPHGSGSRLYSHCANGQPDGANSAVAVQLEGMQEVSDSVKSYTFRDVEGRLAFRAGQWVDLFPPASSGTSAIGGFSFASTPRELKQDGRFRLLIRRSRHPVADWLHTRATEGDQMHVQVGGEFFVEEHHRSSPLLFLAGGIGVAPLYSMLADVLEARSTSSRAPPPTRALLLYSARHPEDFALTSEIRSLVDKAGKDVLQVWDAVTEGPCQPAVPTPADNRLIQPLGSSRRISGRVLSQSDISDALAWLSCGSQAGPPVAFLCGPPAFADSCASHLAECGLAPERIVYEKWW